MRILIVGAGAVGGYFGARLVQAGRDVTFLVRQKRAEKLRASGLRIISPHGDAIIKPALITSAEINVPFDVIFLSVKGFALAEAMEDFAPAVGPATLILPVLNGMRHMKALQARFTTSAVIGGVCVVATQMEDDRIVQIAEIQLLRYGELNGAPSERLRALDAEMKGAGFDADISTDIVQAMWEKWVQLASLGAITCLMRGPIGEIVAVPGGSAWALEVLDECASIAGACGHAPGESIRSQHAAALTTAMSPLTSSMYRDLRSGLPVEVDEIIGDLLRLARTHEVTSPHLDTVHVNLLVYQRSLQR